MLVDYALRAQVLIVFLLGIGVTIVGVAVRAKLAEAIKGKADVGDVRAVEARTASIEARMLAIEGSLRHLPSRDDMQRIELALADQRGDFRAMNEKLAGMHDLMKGDMRRMEQVDEFLQKVRVTG